MNIAVKHLPHYTYDDWVRWEGQWELIDGIPYAMSPAPVPNHQRIGANLCAEFRLPLKSCQKCIAYQPIDYVVCDDTILQPDLLVVCNEITKKYLDFPPSLVAEILSPSTAIKDRHIKFEIYQSQGVKYFIIISPEREKVEIYELENGEYQMRQSGKNLIYGFSFPECSAQIDFKEIW